MTFLQFELADLGKLNNNICVHCAISNMVPMVKSSHQKKNVGLVSKLKMLINSDVVYINLYIALAIIFYKNNI